MQFPSLLALLVMAVSPLKAADVTVVHQWKEVDYKYPSQQARYNAIRSGAFVYGNAIPLDMDASKSDPMFRVFVTTPRLLPGVPAALSTADPYTGLLSPYPDWSWHTQGDCDGITSVLRTKIDNCGQLWVLDSGEVDTFTNASRRICPPQLVVFDVATDKLLWQYKIPDSLTGGRSLLGTVEVMLKNGNCDNAYVYMADLQGYRLLVLDAKTPRAWAANSNLFYPFPFDGHFNINGREFDLMDGVFGLALSPENQITGDRTLYFHSLASRWESMVSTRTLNRESNFRNGQSPISEFSVSVGQRSGQAGPSGMDKKGRLFFSILTENSLNCWNSKLKYTSDNIGEVYQNDINLQFVSGLKVIEESSGREWVYMLSSQLQNIITGSWDKNAVKYRILRAPVDQLVKGTICA